MEGNMKLWVAAIATILFMCWSIVMVESSRIFFAPQTKPDDNYYLDELQADDLTFSVDDPTVEAYSEFLKSLREMLTCYTLEKYHLRVMCTESDLLGQRYSNVFLTYKNVTLALALDSVDLNLVAYSSGKESYFFANTERLKNELFQGTEQVLMEFSNSYTALGSRAAVDLGKSALQAAVESLSTYDESTIKTSLITVIGMVSEAARFKLIENAVARNSSIDIKPSRKIISYEDNWGELSKNIRRATNGMFPSAIVLKNENDVTFKVTSVGQIQGNMGILKYYPPMEAYANILLIKES